MLEYCGKQCLVTTTTTIIIIIIIVIIITTTTTTTTPAKCVLQKYVPLSLFPHRQ